MSDKKEKKRQRRKERMDRAQNWRERCMKQLQPVIAYMMREDMVMASVMEDSRGPVTSTETDGSRVISQRFIIETKRVA